MAENGAKQEKKHTLQLTGREHAGISGVSEVESFDDTMVRLITDCGDLTVEGEGLRVNVLDVGRGLVEIGGLVCGLYYSESGTERRRGRRRLLH